MSAERGSIATVSAPTAAVHTAAAARTGRQPANSPKAPPTTRAAIAPVNTPACRIDTTRPRRSGPARPEATGTRSWGMTVNVPAASTAAASAGNPGAAAAAASPLTVPRTSTISSGRRRTVSLSGSRNNSPNE